MNCLVLILILAMIKGVAFGVGMPTPYGAKIPSRSCGLPVIEIEQAA